ncbi:HigA family addiction module antidote protein [Mesorhizobium sp. BR1-1-16]|uniref:HigA family addiction module antitoxin n=1 Tax=Mesorhizobium sp. BR1-1-16 TaxID=2876653 RepID=UPI001CCA3C62|nr:HigA family addiction module antitoxin [Mesorhizobium sp. BR1-1-16]MBZ9934809.1 HigA family addiction module antidote protein [Mesorhizobium sp. BR1-1-16]
MSMNPILSGLPPTHPGEILREDVLPGIHLSKTEIARLLGVSRQTLHDVLAERQPVTPAMALRLAKLFGSSPQVWINLQRDYDLRVLAESMREELAAIQTLPRNAA